ncbi:MAG: molybdate ABC transporter substrate-binding protein [Anaerolineales bacterium]|nr:MAG: molybdate ABC transporter substrate-binding protein [Anaerolineales bacterium]
MHRRLVMLSLWLVIVLSGCSGLKVVQGSVTDNTQVDSAATHGASQNALSSSSSLTVFAAASLTGAFQEMAANFEKANPGVNIQLNLAGSQILSTQIAQGAPADIFASADHKNMDRLVEAGLVMTDTIKDFAINQLVVILPEGNPANVVTLSDLVRPNLKIVLADETVPAGKYARQVLANLGADPAYGPDFDTRVLANVVSNETDVKQVVTKVELGEADVGIVYTSDAIAASNLPTIPIPDAYNITARYPIAVLAESQHQNLAEAFIEYILSAEGQAVLNRWGFNQPRP